MLGLKGSRYAPARGRHPNPTEVAIWLQRLYDNDIKKFQSPLNTP